MYARLGQICHLVAGLLLVTGGAQLKAAEFPDLYVSGFASQGFLISSHNAFLVKNSVEGSFEFNEAAVTVQSMPTDQLRIGIQMLARDLGDEGNNQVYIDWAGLDYRWRDELGIRAGKIKIPIGLYNQARDVDFLRTSILLPQSNYAVRQRDFVLAHEGLSIYGSHGKSDWDFFDYELFCGTLTVPDLEAGFWGDVYELYGMSAGSVLRRAYASRYGVDSADVNVLFMGTSEREVEFPIFYGGSLIWNLPLHGLRFGTSWSFSEFRQTGRWSYVVNAVDSTGTERNEAVGVINDIEIELDQLASFSAEFTRGPLVLAAELYSIVLDESGEGADREQGYYGSISYRLSSLFTVGSYYSEYYADANDRDGDANAAQGLPRWTAWEKDAALSLRFDVSPNWTLKAEYHHLDGVALQSQPDLLERLAQGTLEQHWSALLLKTTVHF